MIKRTIEISQEPVHLCVRLGQLLLKRQQKTVRTIPCEDIGFIVVDHPQTTYSHSAIVELARSGAALVICGNNHLPSAVLLPFADHSEVVWRLKEQLAASRPIRKQIWKQLIRAKIIAQANNLDAKSPARSKLLAMAHLVRSGDPSNIEAQAARIYWPKFLGDPTFRRDTNGRGINELLNYGYAIVRAAIARAIVAAGYLPSVGLKHSNRGNAFCLADDLIEPLRPLVDRQARTIFCDAFNELNQETKAPLLRLLTEEVKFGDESGPLMINLHRYMASLRTCFRGESKKLEIPQACI